MTRLKVGQHIVVAEPLARADAMETEPPFAAEPVDETGRDAEMFGELAAREEGGQRKSSTKGIPVCAEMRNAVLTLKDFLP